MRTRPGGNCHGRSTGYMQAEERVHMITAPLLTPSWSHLQPCSTCVATLVPSSSRICRHLLSSLCSCRVHCRATCLVGSPRTRHIPPRSTSAHTVAGRDSLIPRRRDLREDLSQEESRRPDWLALNASAHGPASRQFRACAHRSGHKALNPKPPHTPRAASRRSNQRPALHHRSIKQQKSGEGNHAKA